MSPMVPPARGETDPCAPRGPRSQHAPLSGKVREGSQRARHLKAKDGEEFIICVRFGPGREERTSRWRELPLQKHVGETEKERERDRERERWERDTERWRETDRQRWRETESERDRDRERKRDGRETETGREGERDRDGAEGTQRDRHSGTGCRAEQERGEGRGCPEGGAPRRWGERGSLGSPGLARCRLPGKPGALS